MSRTHRFFYESLPLKTTVSRKVISFSGVSAVNFILVRKLSKDRPHGLPMWLLWLRRLSLLEGVFNCIFRLNG